MKHEAENNPVSGEARTVEMIMRTVVVSDG